MDLWGVCLLRGWCNMVVCVCVILLCFDTLVLILGCAVVFACYAG